MSPFALILLFSGLAAGVGAGLAPLPGSDTPILVTLQTALILSLADKAGIPLTRAAAAQLALPFAATIIGRTVCSLLLGWIPLLGSFANAFTAFLVTWYLGQAAWRWFLAEADD